MSMYYYYMYYPDVMHQWYHTMYYMSYHFKQDHFLDNSITMSTRYKHRCYIGNDNNETLVLLWVVADIKHVSIDRCVTL